MEDVRENLQLVYNLSHPNIAAVRTLERFASCADFAWTLAGGQSRPGGRVPMEPRCPQRGGEDATRASRPPLELAVSGATARHAEAAFAGPRMASGSEFGSGFAADRSKE